MKTVTWSFISIIITFSVAWVITGDIQTSVAISFISRAIKILIYYAHERVWHKQYKAQKKAAKLK